MDTWLLLAEFDGRENRVTVADQGTLSIHTIIKL
jgi:hypothetical protein